MNFYCQKYTNNWLDVTLRSFI